MFAALWKATQGEWQCWMCNQRESCPLIRARSTRGPPLAADSALPGPGAPPVGESNSASGRKTPPQLSPVSLRSPKACPGSATSLSRGKRDFVVDCLNKADVPQAAAMPNPLKLNAGPGCAPQAGQRWRQQLIDGPAHDRPPQMPTELPSFYDNLSARTACSHGHFDPIDDHYLATVESTRARLAQTMATEQRRAERARRSKIRVTDDGGAGRSLSKTASDCQPHENEKFSAKIPPERLTSPPALAAETTGDTEEAPQEESEYSDEGERIDVEYERRMSSDRIRRAKAVAKGGNASRGWGLNQEKESYSSRSLRRTPGTKVVDENQQMRAVQEQEVRNDVESYQDLMTGKFNEIGARRTEQEQWKSTDAKSHAVVEGVTKYHGHCVALGQPFAMPGDAVSYSGDLCAQNDEFQRITHADADGITRLWPRKERSSSDA